MKAHGRWLGSVHCVEGQSVLSHSLHTAPLKVAKTFKAPSGDLMVYLMDVSAGLFGGDTQYIECHVGPGAHLFLTTQAACKLHPAVDQTPSVSNQKLYLAENAVLEYFPEPLVPFAGAHHEGAMEVWLQRGATAFIGEIISAGRVGRGEQFQYHRLASSLSVYLNSQLVVFDPLDLEPRRWRGMSAVFEEFTHVASLWALSETVGDIELRRLQGLLDQPQWQRRLYGGCSKLQHGGLIFRVLGKSAWELQEIVFQAWSILRQQVLNKPRLQIRK